MLARKHWRNVVPLKQCVLYKTVIDWIIITLIFMSYGSANLEGIFYCE